MRSTKCVGASHVIRGVRVGGPRRTIAVVDAGSAAQDAARAARQLGLELPVVDSRAAALVVDIRL